MSDEHGWQQFAIVTVAVLGILFIFFFYSAEDSLLCNVIFCCSNLCIYSLLQFNMLGVSIHTRLELQDWNYNPEISEIFFFFFRLFWLESEMLLKGKNIPSHNASALEHFACKANSISHCHTSKLLLLAISSRKILLHSSVLLRDSYH